MDTRKLKLRAWSVAGVLLALFAIAGCGGPPPGGPPNSSVAVATPTLTTAPTVAPTATPFTGSAHIVLSGDTTIDTVTPMSPTATACGPNARGGWGVSTESPSVQAGIVTYAGDGTYPVSQSTNYMVVIGLASAHYQNITARSGSIVVDQGGKHAVYNGTAGFVVQPGPALSGTVAEHMEFTCP